MAHVLERIRAAKALAQPPDRPAAKALAQPPDRPAIPGAAAKSPISKAAPQGLARKQHRTSGGQGSQGVEGDTFEGCREDPSAGQPLEMDAASVFVYYDRDGDGRLTQREFLGALRAMGACPSTSDFEDVCKHLGSTPDIRAFREALREVLKKRPTSDHLVAQFRSLAQGGLVDGEVLRYTATHYGECLDEAEAEELMRLAIPDKDGNVDIKYLAEVLLPPLSRKQRRV